MLVSARALSLTITNSVNQLATNVQKPNTINFTRGKLFTSSFSQPQTWVHDQALVLMCMYMLATDSISFDLI